MWRRRRGLIGVAGKGTTIGDMDWSLTDLDGDGQPDLAFVADVVERPDNPGSEITMPVAPGGPGGGAWRLHRNVP